MMKRCVIVGGAPVADYKRIRGMLRDDDHFIYCDSGLMHMEGLGRIPDLIVGDFDSAQDPHMDVETIVLPREKDDTDTVYAVKEAIKRGYSEFLLTGVCGERLDHTLGNLSILYYLDSLGKNGTIIDDHSVIELVSDKPVFIEDRYRYFSLINMSGCAEGITIRGAKYPLEDAVITTQYQYGISNEVLKGSIAEVSVKNGRLLLIKVETE